MHHSLPSPRKCSNLRDRSHPYKLPDLWPPNSQDLNPIDYYVEHRKVDFAKDIAKSLTRRCKSRPTGEMSNAKLSKHSDEENDDFSLFDEFIFPSYVETDVSKRFSQQSRTELPLRSCLYDV